MPNRNYLVRLKPPSSALQYVQALGAETYGEHLVFVDSEGKLMAMFHGELVECWNELILD